MIGSQAFLKKIQAMIDAKPSVLALIGEPGAGKNYITKNIARQLLNVDNIESYPHFQVIDAKESGIEEVRTLQKELALAVPSSNQISRVVLIRHFDYFKHEAQNAMLKTLEEPPLSTTIILTIENEQRVLQTIFSRVQRVYVPPINLSLAIESFPNTSVAAVTKAFYESGGNVGLLSKILQSDEMVIEVSAIASARQLLGASKFERIAKIDAISKDKKIPAEEMLQGLLKLINASARQAVDSAQPREATIGRYRQVDAVLQCLTDIKNGVNTKLAMTRLFLTL